MSFPPKLADVSDDVQSEEESAESTDTNSEELSEGSLDEFQDLKESISNQFKEHQLLLEQILTLLRSSVLPKTASQQAHTPTCHRVSLSTI